MRIQTSDLPQADRIDSVLLATVAIANGAKTDIAIANQVPAISGDARQGRYYRKAAEILGFVTNRRNNAQITPRGQQIADNPTLTNPTLFASVINLNLYQKLLPYIELNPQGLTKQQIEEYLESIAIPTIGDSMIERRMSTIIAWIRSLGIIELVGDKYRIANSIINSIPVIDFQDISQPVLPATGTLHEYQTVEQRILHANKTIVVYKDAATLERANRAHKTLVNIVADRIRNAGGIPKSNQFIDLATTIEKDYIFEMKSTTAGNVNSQIRKGISQLYEYRYLENKPDASLILVIENPLSTDESWMLDYMETDRNIHLVWDGNNNLYGSPNTRDQLGFLELLP